MVLYRFLEKPGSIGSTVQEALTIIRRINKTIIKVKEL
ncbi:hypothetical protein DJ93_782 [Bacillus clarus]|uniref:Uncharacterized protein n=1 Tax=Bacillus clarus TaxID=2338372 RepID=A0A090YZP9_9BACI|nr:hypothetical protein DJ93_782 [Bacillus clarus]